MHFMRGEKAYAHSTLSKFYCDGIGPEVLVDVLAVIISIKIFIVIEAIKSSGFSSGEKNYSMMLTKNWNCLTTPPSGSPTVQATCAA